MMLLEVLLHKVILKMVLSELCPKKFPLEMSSKISSLKGVLKMFPQKNHSIMFLLRMFSMILMILMNALKMVSELSSAKRYSKRFLLERISLMFLLKMFLFPTPFFFFFF